MFVKVPLFHATQAARLYLPKVHPKFDSKYHNIVTERKNNVMVESSIRKPFFPSIHFPPLRQLNVYIILTNSADASNTLTFLAIHKMKKSK